MQQQRIIPTTWHKTRLQLIYRCSLVVLLPTHPLLLSLKLGKLEGKNRNCSMLKLYLLPPGGYVFTSVHLFFCLCVFLFVCRQDIPKSIRPMFNVHVKQTYLLFTVKSKIDLLSPWPWVRVEILSTRWMIRVSWDLKPFKINEKYIRTYVTLLFIKMVCYVGSISIEVQLLKK